jgi:hypothetical protein
MTAKPPMGPAVPIGDEAFAEAHRTLLADSAIQFDLPAYQPPQVPDWLRWLSQFAAGDHPILRALLWGLAIAAGLLLAYLVARWLSGAGWPWRRREEAKSEDWRPDEAPARQLLGEADALAAQGRYSEAAHLLLFRSIEDIDSRRPDLVRPAFTSRDIAALPAIPTGPRSAFARIALLVERSLFARRPLAAGDWRDCRTAYEEFAFAEAWGG